MQSATTPLKLVSHNATVTLLQTRAFTAQTSVISFRRRFCDVDGNRMAPLSVLGRFHFSLGAAYLDRCGYSS